MLLPPVDVTGRLWSVYAMCAAKNFLVFIFLGAFFLSWKTMLKELFIASPLSMYFVEFKQIIILPHVS